MKQVIVLILFLLFYLLGFGQDKYAVSFTDKNNSPYSVNNPEQFLSQKAIARRIKQNIEIVVEDIPVNQNYINNIITIGADFLYASKWMNLMVVKIADVSILPTISSLPFVAKVVKIKSENVTNNQFKQQDKFAIESSTVLDYGDGDDQIKIMSGEFLHNAGLYGDNMTIAVLDAGFTNVNQISSFTHLWNENRILGVWDFVNNNDSVFDKHSHGTAVLSTMASNTPGGLIGTAPKANYWLLRTEDAATETISEEYNWLAGAEFADSVGADIINSSLGYTTFDDTTQNHTYADMNGITTVISKAANMAASKGILVVNSAGNSGSSSWMYIGAPADAENVFSIAAIEHDGTYSSFSSVGPSSDGRLKPNVAAIGRNSAVLDINGVVQAYSGTSFSSPEIAGISACLWQAYPNKTSEEIKDAIERSAHQFNNPDNLLGYGIPNFKVAYFLLSGYGITDVNQDQFLNIYPQPFISDFRIDFYSSTDQTISVKITDVTGKLVYSSDWQLQKGVINKLDIVDIQAAGVYVLNLQSATEEIIRKIVRQ
jgi:serine protease AprX